MLLRMIVCLLCCSSIFAQQKIADFVSITPGDPTTEFVIPNSHTFQYLLQKGDTLSDGSIFPGINDYAGYMPINGSSLHGYLCVNSESLVGQVTVLDIRFNKDNLLWESSHAVPIDFSSVGGTIKNCAGMITPWDTFITCEEFATNADDDDDGYHDFGWCVEVDPANKEVIDKLWALGNFVHENVTIHDNLRTVYQGSDQHPGYLFKFVADTPSNLSNGTLSVYQGEKNGVGQWNQLANTTQEERNNTIEQLGKFNATPFEYIEEVEIGPDGWVYVAVAGEDQVYRFLDYDPLSAKSSAAMETFVGNMEYEIEHMGGNVSVNWGNGNDNMAFDNDGNLWVLQDGFTNYIWVVEAGHTQENPKVKIFGNSPIGAEPTGITFSPDNRFLFMSLQHPSYNNNQTTQIDAGAMPVSFARDITFVIARKEHLGTTANPVFFDTELDIYPSPSSGIFNIDVPIENAVLDIYIYTANGHLLRQDQLSGSAPLQVSLAGEANGVYYLKVLTEQETVGTYKLVKQ